MRRSCLLPATSAGGVYPVVATPATCMYVRKSELVHQFHSVQLSLGPSPVTRSHRLACVGYGRCAGTKFILFTNQQYELVGTSPEAV